MKKKQAVRFSLAFLLLLITTAGVWLAAYRHGYQMGDGAWRYGSDYSMAYDVHDLVEPIPIQPAALGPQAPAAKYATVDAEPLLEVLRASLHQAPDDSTRIVFFPGNLSVIVSGSGRAHRQVTETLELLRERPKKWKVLVAGDENWIPDDTVVYDAVVE